MVGEDGIPTPKKRDGKLTYFYLNGNLHRTLVINRGDDSIVTWCYPLEKRVAYTYSDTKKYREPAFTSREVGKLLNRSKISMERAVQKGAFPPPQHTYGIDEHKRMYKYMWSEQDIMNAHDYFLTRHRGRPRNDGLVVPAAMPTKRELRAMIRNDQTTYVWDGEKFVPSWRAKNFD